METTFVPQKFIAPKKYDFVPNYEVSETQEHMLYNFLIGEVEVEDIQVDLYKDHLQVKAGKSEWDITVPFLGAEFTASLYGPHLKISIPKLPTFYGKYNIDGLFP